MTYILLAALFFTWSILLNQLAHYLIAKNKEFFTRPYFETVMTFCLLMLWNNTYFYSYFILFSALGITIQTDLQSMLISRFASIYLVPIPLLLSFFNYLPLHPIDSIISSCLGYGFFYMVNKIFFFFKKENGLGEGDFDLMAFIGSYTGIMGVWFTILAGSILGFAATCSYMVYHQKRISHIPFGPFLSLGAIIFVLFQDYIQRFFL